MTDPADYWYAWKPIVFRKATKHMTAAQKGIYRELIDEYMIDREPLPDNPEILARIAGVSPEIFNDAWRIVGAKFHSTGDGFLIHNFCNTELDEQDKRSKKRSKAASKAATARWQAEKKRRMRDACAPDAQGNADAMRQNATLHYKTEQDRTKKEEKEKSKKEKEETKTHLDLAINSGEAFERFWKTFPGARPKGNKQAAWKSYQKITTSKGAPNANDLITTAGHYRDFCARTASYNQHAVTWLNQRGWETDWLEQAAGGAGAPGQPGGGANAGAAGGDAGIDGQAEELRRRYYVLAARQAEAEPQPGAERAGDHDAGAVLEDPEALRREG